MYSLLRLLAPVVRHEQIWKTSQYSEFTRFWLQAMRFKTGKRPCFDGENKKMYFLCSNSNNIQLYARLTRNLLLNEQKN